MGEPSRDENKKLAMATGAPDVSGGGVIFSALLRPPGPAEGTDQQATLSLLLR